ncbi:MAG: helix-turn-helix domain containing protein [Planctomycetota bacterium]|jgi:AcrR family transcriptional regulator|nr:helix-turn-helix domain containing protein [Planctomycetota bacterium]
MPELSSAKSVAILDAAIAEFRTKGFAASRIADIAAAAGVGKGTVYEYYRAKEDLLLEACLYTCTRNELTMSGDGPIDPTVGFGTPPGANPVRVIHDTLVTVIGTILVSSRSEFRLFSDLQSISADQPELMERVRERFVGKIGDWRAMALAQMESGIANGLLRPLPELSSAAHMIVATVDGLIWQHMWETDADPHQLAGDMARTWCRLLMHEPQRLEEYLA